MAMSPRPRLLWAALPVGVVGLLALIAGCASGPASGLPLPAITERVDGEAAEQIVGADRLAEYDSFTAAQQLPEDPSSPLTAVTPEQEAFIADEKAIAVRSGRTWTADEETIALSLGFEGCQIAILNGHAVDADLLRMHVQQSDIYAYLIDPSATAEERTLLEAELTRTLARGAMHLCPEDGARWTTAADEVYGT
jgi:hypothetical protein